MKKILSIILSVVFLLSLCSCSTDEKVIAGDESSVLPKGQTLKIVAFGDSIAAGYGLESQQDNYLSIFAKNLSATLVNNAISGYDSRNLKELLQSGTKNGDIRQANVIVLSIGGNDLLHNSEMIIGTLKNAYLQGGDYFTEEINAIYNNFENNLNEIITIIRNINPNCSIIIQTLYNPALEQGYKVSVIDAAKPIDKYIVRLNESIVSVCKGKHNVFVFDIYDEMNKDKDNFYELKTEFDIHPTKKGHASMAELFTKYYNEYTDN